MLGGISRIMIKKQEPITVQLISNFCNLLEGQGIYADEFKELFIDGINESIVLLKDKSRFCLRLINIGFNKLTGLSESDYYLSIPQKPKLNQKFFQRGFDKLVLVDPRISINTQLNLIGINTDLDLNNLHDLVVSPKQPYWIQVNDGNNNRGKSPKSCLSNLCDKARGLTVIEGISLYMHFPSILSDHFIYLPGSYYGTYSNVPHIRIWKGKPGLYADSSQAYTHYGSAFCIPTHI